MNSQNLIRWTLVPCAVLAAASQLNAESTGLALHSRAVVTQVEVSEPTVVHEEGAEPPYYYPQAALTQLKDGSLLLAGKDGPLVLVGTSNKILQSTDQGRTWQKQADALSDYKLLQLRNGSFYLLRHNVQASAKPGVFLAGRIHLQRLADLASANPPRWSEIPITITQFKTTVSDDYKTVKSGPVVDPALELSDGTLLALSYGNFVGDDVPIIGFKSAAGAAPMYRTYLLSSTDGGDSWGYFSTIAYDGKTGQESFCEPDLVDFGQGELLAVMRTGRFAPLHQARSLDGGKTWSKPESLETLGLQPKLALLGNGVLVCSFGWRPLTYDYWHDPSGGLRLASLTDYHQRYKSEVGIEDPSAAAGDYVMFSPDRGHTWSEPRKIAEPLTQGYTQLAPAGPDSCLMLSYRYVLPGKSTAYIAHQWERERIEFFAHLKTIYEARRITVTR